MEQTANTAPLVKLGQYKGLSYTRRVRPVTENAVELEVANRARNHAPFSPIETPAARGDQVNLDFAGFLDGAPIPESEVKDVTVVLGTGQLMTAAEEAVYGHCAGDTFVFDFTYPNEFRVPALSNLTAQFRIVLHSVARRQPMTPDDAFAQSCGFASLEAMKDDIREAKRRSHEANADRVAGAALLDMAADNLTAELPTDLLNQSVDHEMKQLESKLARSRLTMAIHCGIHNTTPEKIRADFYQEAAHRMRVTLAVRAIADAEHIVVHKEEVDTEYAHLSKLHDTPEDEIRKVLAPDAIAAVVIQRKVQAFLIEHANFTSVVEKE